MATVQHVKLTRAAKQKMAACYKDVMTAFWNYIEASPDFCAEDFDISGLQLFLRRGEDTSHAPSRILSELHDANVDMLSCTMYICLNIPFAAGKTALNISDSYSDILLSTSTGCGREVDSVLQAAHSAHYSKGTSRCAYGFYKASQPFESLTAAVRIEVPVADSDLKEI